MQKTWLLCARARVCAGALSHLTIWGEVFIGTPLRLLYHAHLVCVPTSSLMTSPKKERQNKFSHKFNKSCRINPPLPKKCPPPIKVFDDAASVGGDTATFGGKKQYSSSNMFKHKNNFIFFRTVTKSQKIKKRPNGLFQLF